MGVAFEGECWLVAPGLYIANMKILMVGAVSVVSVDDNALRTFLNEHGQKQ